MDVTRRIGTGAGDGKVRPERPAQQAFGKVGAATVAGAEHEDERWWIHRENGSVASTGTAAGGRLGKGRGEHGRNHMMGRAELFREAICMLICQGKNQQPSFGGHAGNGVLGDQTLLIFNLDRDVLRIEKRRAFTQNAQQFPGLNAVIIIRPDPGLELADAGGAPGAATVDEILRDLADFRDMEGDGHGIATGQAQAEQLLRVAGKGGFEFGKCHGIEEGWGVLIADAEFRQQSSAEAGEGNADSGKGKCFHKARNNGREPRAMP